MGKELRELINDNISGLEDARWAIESMRIKYVIGEDCAKLEALESALSKLITANILAVNRGNGE